MNGSRVVDLNLITIGRAEDFDLHLAAAVLLHFYESCRSDVLVLVQPKG